MYLQQHIQTAIKIIESYKKDLPFAAYLKQYFAANKKHGSKDRKFITQCGYAYWRLGRSLPDSFDAVIRMRIGLLLSEHAANFISFFEEEEKEVAHKSLAERLAFVTAGYPIFDRDNIFPFSAELSSEIDRQLFNDSHLNQPNVFLRARPGKLRSIQSALLDAGIEFNVHGDAVELTPSVKAENIITINRDAVVQDISSQHVADMFDDMQLGNDVRIWDCCAASGGKSILATDKLKMQNAKAKIDLTVSDVRESIIHNLKKRFSEAGIQAYHSFVADLSKPVNLLTDQLFDLIICDAPCTGSGTWGRTPEQLLMFDEKRIDHYSSLQKTILRNASRHVKQGGYFLYITCSVFRNENEEVAAFAENECGLKQVKLKYYKGYDRKADSLFAALFTL